MAKSDRARAIAREIVESARDASTMAVGVLLAGGAWLGDAVRRWRRKRALIARLKAVSTVERRRARG